MAAEIRKEIAETDLRNHELQIENAKKSDEFMRDKFTNNELYGWMIGQISSVYFGAYKLAHDVAKKAERSYQFELGRDDSFIAYGYWDSMKKGLESSNGLLSDLKRMEVSYLDNNKREYEITKHISLASLDPLAATPKIPATTTASSITSAPSNPLPPAAPKKTAACLSCNSATTATSRSKAPVP